MNKLILMAGIGFCSLATCLGQYQKTQVTTNTLAQGTNGQVLAVLPGGGINWVTLVDHGGLTNLLGVSNPAKGDLFYLQGTPSVTNLPIGTEFSRLVVGTNGTPEWLDESDEVYINESFILAQSQFGATTATSGSGSATLAPGAPPAPFANTGFAKLSSTSNSTSMGYVRWSGNVVSGTRPVWTKSIAMNAQSFLLTANDKGTNCMFLFGASDVTVNPLTAASGIHWLARLEWSTNWIAWSQALGVNYYATSSFPVLTNTMFSLSYKGSTNAVSFYTNGAYCGITLTNLPAGGVEMFPIVRPYNYMGTNVFTGSNQIWLDKFQARIK